LPASNVTCIGDGDKRTCLATWACMVPGNKNTIYAGLNYEPFHAMLTGRWRNQQRVRLNVATITMANMSGVSNVSVFGGTTMLAMRFVMGNFGHVLFENLVPLVKAHVALNQTKELDSMRVILLDDCSTARAPGNGDLMWSSVYRYDERACRHRFPDLITSTIRGSSVFELSELDENTLSGLVSLEWLSASWQHQIQRFRRETPEHDTAPRVLIHQKDRNHTHGGALMNAGRICDALRKCTPDIKCEVMSLSNSQTLREQLEMIVNADVYVSDAGSAMYYAFFLPPGALHVTYQHCAPRSRPDACKGNITGNVGCHNLFYYILQTIPHINSVLIAGSMAESLSYWPSSDVKACIEHTTWYQRSYDMDVPVQETLRVITDHLAQRMPRWTFRCIA
jgi:hypothetical protein